MVQTVRARCVGNALGNQDSDTICTVATISLDVLLRAEAFVFGRQDRALHKNDGAHGANGVIHLMRRDKSPAPSFLCKARS